MLFKSMWWKVLFVHSMLLFLWLGGFNYAGLSLLLLLSTSFLAYKLGEKKSKPIKRKASVMFRG